MSECGRSRRIQTIKWISLAGRGFSVKMIYIRKPLSIGFETSFENENIFTCNDRCSQQRLMTLEIPTSLHVATLLNLAG